MVNDKTLRTSMVKSLDMLYQGLQGSQRTAEAILGQIETQHRSLIFKILIKGELETLPVAQRRLFEQGFRDIDACTHTGYWFGWGFVGVTAPCDWFGARHRALWSRKGGANYSSSAHPSSDLERAVGARARAHSEGVALGLEIGMRIFSRVEAR